MFYASQVIASQAQKGDWDYEISPVVVVCILDFEFDDDFSDKIPQENLVIDNENYISHVQLIETKSQKLFYTKLDFYYVELPKFLKLEPELQSDLDYWLYCFKNMENLTKNTALGRNLKFKVLLDECALANLSTKERVIYDENLKIYRDLVCL